jgi:hypothetical protein
MKLLRLEASNRCVNDDSVMQDVLAGHTFAIISGNILAYRLRPALTCSGSCVVGVAETNGLANNA